MDALRRRIVHDFEKNAGSHDDVAIYGGPPGDPGLIGPGSVSWEIHADLASVSQAGLPATALIDRVRRIHSSVQGTRPDGVPYRALDPELIAWVHTCIPWMILRTFEGTNRPLSPAEKDSYLAEQAVIGRMGGAERVPASAAELDDYVKTMRPKLSVNAQTREFLGFLMEAPFVPNLPTALDRELHLFAIYAGMSRAPRWAFGTTRYVQLARARVGAQASARAR
jgi:uncharacterized protein (DUF2236 family)